MTQVTGSQETLQLILCTLGAVGHGGGDRVSTGTSLFVLSSRAVRRIAS